MISTDLNDVKNFFATEVDLNEEKNNILTNEENTNSLTNSVDNTIENIAETLKKNIEKEVSKIDVDSSIWEKITQNQFFDVVKTSLEETLKSVLKNKFKVKFSTFNDMKDTWNAVMDGNLKEALKKSSDAAIDTIKVFTPTVRTGIKKVKNVVIDKTIDSEKYEVINKQTKIINKISNNCQKFNEAMQINDSKNIKKVAKAIEKDMKAILPIRETISMAQNVLDKYSLWKEKGENMLSQEEVELIEKLNECA